MLETAGVSDDVEAWIESAETATLAALRSALPDAELLLGGRAIDGEEHARSLGATGWAADGLGAAQLLDLARR